VRIIEELTEIWSNEVCNSFFLSINFVLVKSRLGRGWKRGVMDRSILQNNVLHYFREYIALSNDGETQKKTLTEKKRHWSGVQLNK